MKSSKRILSLLLALLTVCSCLSAVSFSASATIDDGIVSANTVDKNYKASVGETVSMRSVYLKRLSDKYGSYRGLTIVGDVDITFIVGEDLVTVTPENNGVNKKDFNVTFNSMGLVVVKIFAKTKHSNMADFEFCDGSWTIAFNVGNKSHKVTFLNADKTVFSTTTTTDRGFFSIPKDVPAAPDAEHYFIGWTIDKTETYAAGKKFYTGTDITFKPVYEFSVLIKWDLNLDGAMSSYTFSDLETKGVFQIPTEVPFKAGYAFFGWDTYALSQYPEFLPGDTVGTGKNMTLYGVWEKINTLSYNLNRSGASYTNPSLFATTSTRSLYEIPDEHPVCPGMCFLGWATSPSATKPEYYAGGKIKISKATTLYAVWASAYSVTFKLNKVGSFCESCDYSLLTNVSEFTVPGDVPICNGYLFQGWSESSNASTPTWKPGDTISVTKHMTLYGVWVALPAGGHETGIEIIKAPKKTEYYTGEIFDPAGIRVILKYDTGAYFWIPASSLKYSTEPFTKSGYQLFPISYTVGSKTFSTTINKLTILNNPDDESSVITHASVSDPQKVTEFGYTSEDIEFAQNSSPSINYKSCAKVVVSVKNVPEGFFVECEGEKVESKGAENTVLVFTTGSLSASKTITVSVTDGTDVIINSQGEVKTDYTINVKTGVGAKISAFFKFFFNLFRRPTESVSIG
ncbi:MAG TPA: hypothetical protein DDY98_01760 [Ruminococcaceae bacterium]|nr:hypothetical protein [Oscillospiraceae bacterium]